jgi:hypothetical protein
MDLIQAVKINKGETRDEAYTELLDILGLDK